MTLPAEPKSPGSGITPELVGQVRELLLRAILTLAAVPDPDLRFRIGPKNSWPPFVRHVRDAYGSAAPKVRAFHPDERDLSRFLEVLGWLDWYARQGSESENDVKLFRAWTLGAAIWQLQERCQTNRRRPASPRTVYNRLDRVVIRILERFGNAARMAMLDELQELHDFAPSQGHGPETVQSDLRDLPTPSKHWISEEAVAAQQAHRGTPEAAKAERQLVRRLEKNQRRAAARLRASRPERDA